MLYQHSVYSFSGREYSDLEKQDSIHLCQLFG